MLLHLFT